jgi:peptidoglycan-associated lipoprotein
MRFLRGSVSVVGVALCFLLVAGCTAKKDIRLEMRRETVIHDPVISSLKISPSGNIDTRDRGYDVTVSMEGDPGLVATFDVEGAFDGRSMEEVEPGVYRATFAVPKGATGSVSAVGHLVHPPSGANQEFKTARALSYKPSPPPPPPAPKVCDAAMARDFDQRLREVTAYFEFDSFEITDDAKSVLTSNKALLASNPLCTIFVLGHADWTGEDVYNDYLSNQRAEAVVAFLETMGISNTRIVRHAYGSKKPADKSIQKRNRRVELRAINPYGS